MAFRYPLQSVLRLRESLERQEEQRLFALAAVVARLRAEVEEFEKRVQETQRVALKEITNGCSGAALQFAAACEAAATAALRELQAGLAEAEQRRLEQVAIYQKAREKREIFAGLRERLQAIYARDAAHREQQRADEAFLMGLVGDAATTSVPSEPAKPAEFAMVLAGAAATVPFLTNLSNVGSIPYGGHGKRM
jgi:flagellar export protein FliJ